MDKERQQELLNKVKDMIIAEDYNIVDSIMAISGVVVWLMAIAASIEDWNYAKKVAKEVCDGIEQKVEELSKFTIPNNQLN